VPSTGSFKTASGCQPCGVQESAGVRHLQACRPTSENHRDWQPASPYGASSKAHKAQQGKGGNKRHPNLIERRLLRPPADELHVPPPNSSDREGSLSHCNIAMVRLPAYEQNLIPPMRGNGSPRRPRCRRRITRGDCVKAERACRGSRRTRMTAGIHDCPRCLSWSAAEQASGWDGMPDSKQCGNQSFLERS